MHSSETISLFICRKKNKIPSLNEIMNLVKNEKNVTNYNSSSKTNHIYFMAINLNLKIILKVLITFLIVKDSLASTISGYEIKSLIEKWLEKHGEEANINILESLKYQLVNQII